MSSSVLTPPTRSESLLSVSSGPDFVKPAFINIPDEYDPERTLGPHVGALATLAGFAPDPEQQLALDVSFALDKRGRPLIFKSIVIAPRQNLKTGFAKQRVLGKQFILQRPLVVWSAHEFDTARRALIDLEGLIEGCPDLRRKVALTSRGKVATHGAVPEIKLLPKYGGATLAFKTRTAGGGRGLTGDDLTVDEAFAAQAAQMGAVLPIMLARPLSQVDFLSSACRPESAYLWELIQLGRSGSNDGRTFYVEWCLPPPSEVCDRGEACKHILGMPGCGLDKPEVLRLGHPAITRERITLQKIADLRGSMPGEEGGREAGRELGGWHDEPVESGDAFPVTVEEWQNLEDLDRGNAPKQMATFAVEVDLDRAWASIGAAGWRSDERIHLEMVERRRGTDWIVDVCVALDDEHGPAEWAIDGGGPAKSLIKPLQLAGLKVVVLGAGDVGTAAADLVDAVNQDAIRHGPQPELDQAIEGAQKRPLGDGVFTIGRKKSTVDVTPLVTVMLARHLAVMFGSSDVANEFG